MPCRFRGNDGRVILNQIRAAAHERLPQGVAACEPYSSLPSVHTKVLVITRSIYLVGLALSVHSSGLFAQPATQLRRCVNCALATSESRELRVQDDAGVLPETPMQVTPLSTDAYAVLGMDLLSVRLTVKGDASLLLPSGSGPNEQRAILNQLNVADTVFLFDVALRRVTSLIQGVPSAHRNWLSPPFVSIGRFPSGWVVNANFPSAANSGYPFHILDEEGRVRRSFGPKLEGRSADANAEDLRHRVLYNPKTGRILTVKERAFVISTFGVDGTKLKEFVSNPDFWKMPSPSDAVEGATMPFTYVRDARLDADGRLWIGIVKASANWKNHLESVTMSDGRSVKRITNIGQGYRSTIVVVDLERAAITATTEVPGMLLGFGIGDRAVFWQGDNEVTGTPILREVAWRKP